MVGGELNAPSNRLVDSRRNGFTAIGVTGSPIEAKRRGKKHESARHEQHRNITPISDRPEIVVA